MLVVSDSVTFLLNLDKKKLNKIIKKQFFKQYSAGKLAESVAPVA
jgi:hypothetical protein